MNRFEKGDVVFMDRGDNCRRLVVARVIDNPHLPVFQYSFEAPNDGFACGEHSLRDDIDGRDLRMSECFKCDVDKTVRKRINTIASARRHVITGEEVGAVNLFPDTKVDFMPSIEMVKWIAKYAKGRLMIHIGSGQGHLVNMLKWHGKGKTIGIEPNFDKQEWIKWRLLQDRTEDLDINEILEGTVEDYEKLIQSVGAEKCLLIIARPKTIKFIQPTIDLMPEGMEMLYIDLNKDNLFDSVLLEHEGISENNEKVYMFKK